MRAVLTHDEVLRLFEYKDGRLYWKVTVNSKVPKGMLAGCLNHHLNRVYIRINNTAYLRSRIVFLMHYGWLPDQIDHIDGDRSNDAIENLRAATKSQNQHNKRLQRNNSSGVKNVRRRANKWAVELKVNGERKYFGRYDDLDLAELVATEARNLYHGAFANHG